MGARKILSLKSVVSKNEAIAAFAASDSRTMLWRFRHGGLHTVADVYLPYRLFRARLSGKQNPNDSVYAVDAVEGSLDLIEFPEVPACDSLVRMETPNSLEMRLSSAESENLCREKLLRVLFARGFFKMRSAELDVEALPLEIYVPYWLGFYGTPEKLRCRVLNAFRGHMEGGKARALFETWLKTSEIQTAHKPLQ